MGLDQTRFASTHDVGVKNIPAASRFGAASIAIDRAAGAYPDWASATIFDTAWQATECPAVTRVNGGKSWTVKAILDTLVHSVETGD